MAIHFLSPLPPKPTGPADYIMQMLAELERDLGPGVKDQLRLWDEFEHNSHIGILRAMGWQVGDVREAQFEDSDTVFLFLAANSFHAWIWSALARRSVPNIVAVIHDLTAFPLLRALVHDKRVKFDRNDEIQALRAEFGLQAEWIADHYDHLPYIARYFLMGQGITLDAASLVVVHSEYAKCRLTTETVAGLRLPPIEVCEHPRAMIQQGPLISGLPSKDVFCVGSLGFFSLIKRNEVLIEAFGMFVRGLAADEKSKVQLVFVGEIAEKQKSAAQDLIRSWNLSGVVSFTGYVSEEELQAWQSRLDLQFNLRFPSCGESSGTLARAQSMGKRVVCSAFAAFHEEVSTYKVSVDPEQEFPELLKIFSKEYEGWKLGQTSECQGMASQSRKRTFSSLISALLAGKNQMSA